jgi:hypothetical protein
MQVDLQIICLERFINKVCCFFYGYFTHTVTPRVISVLLTTVLILSLPH